MIFFSVFFGESDRILFIYSSACMCVVMYRCMCGGRMVHTRIVKFNFCILNAFSAQIHILKGEEEQCSCKTDIVMW